MFDERQIGSLMVPRADVVTLDVDQPFEENLRRIEQAHHARYPVVKGGLERLLGVLNAHEWLAHALRSDRRELTEETLQPPLYVPETLTGMKLLDNFRSSGVGA